jgi:DNA-directed RNA polymerase omega subunit
MARVFVEAALKKTGWSQFDLITIGAHRARELAKGATPMVEVTDPNEAKTVTALREIEEGLYTLEHYEGKKLTPEQELEQAKKEEDDDGYQLT